ncbi:MAG TPA: lysophospholipid acyltransferase family protein [Polyangia bacterium]
MDDSPATARPTPGNLARVLPRSPKQRSALVKLRSFVSTVFIIFATLLGIALAFLVRLMDWSGETVLILARHWSRSLLWFAGVKVDVTWRAPLSADGRAYVFMANHLSTVDIWAIYAAFPFRLRMLAKKQLAHIPLFGWAMRAGRFIFIDRGNAAAARRSIDQAKERIRHGHHVLIFPEGTRSRDGRLAPFKKGGFHLAIDAGAPIVPVAIRGSQEPMPPGSLLLAPGHVEIVVGAPIPTEGLSEEDRHHLLDRVRTIIAHELPGTEVIPQSALDPRTAREAPTST